MTTTTAPTTAHTSAGCAQRSRPTSQQLSLQHIPAVTVMRRFDPDRPETHGPARTASWQYARREIARLVALEQPGCGAVDSAFSALNALHPSLICAVMTELNLILDCSSDHYVEWWDDIYFAGMQRFLVSEWLLTEEDAEDAVVWLALLEHHGVKGTLGPGALIPQPTVRDARLLLAATVMMVHSLRKPREWYAQHRRCRTCWPA